MSLPLPDSLAQAFAELAARATADGGFRGRDGEDAATSSPSAAPSRPDATALSVLALAASGRDAATVRAARDELVALQAADGRVPFAPDRRDVVWPTALAVLAWHGSPEHRAAEDRACDFLLHSGGVPIPRDPSLGHDTTIIGWSWVLGTHSWVEPTAFGLMALRVCGLGEHPRALEALQLLLDRRLPDGGWNYGNTTTFGQVLNPAPDTTGVALQALAGLVKPALLEPDLAYLEGELETVRSPLTLGWGILGLSAWDRRPEHAVEWIAESLGRQAILGAYDTALLALLLLASGAPEGLLAALEREPSR